MGNRNSTPREESTPEAVKMTIKEIDGELDKRIQEMKKKLEERMDKHLCRCRKVVEEEQTPKPGKTHEGESVDADESSSLLQNHENEEIDNSGTEEQDPESETDDSRPEENPNGQVECHYLETDDSSMTDEEDNDGKSDMDVKQELRVEQDPDSIDSFSAETTNNGEKEANSCDTEELLATDEENGCALDSGDSANHDDGTEENRRKEKDTTEDQEAEVLSVVSVEGSDLNCILQNLASDDEDEDEFKGMPILEPQIDPASIQAFSKVSENVQKQLQDAQECQEVGQGEGVGKGPKKTSTKRKTKSSETKKLRRSLRFQGPSQD